MLLPALNKAREKARSISCVSGLKQIGTAIAMYTDSNDYQGQYPMSTTETDAGNHLVLLGKLGYLTDTNMYICPSDGGTTKSTAPTDWDAIDEEAGINTSYEYVGDMTDSNSSDSPVVFDRWENHTDSGNVLYVAGNVGSLKKTSSDTWNKPLYGNTAESSLAKTGTDVTADGYAAADKIVYCATDDYAKVE